MDKNNNLTVRASLDTSQLKKDLDKFKGEVHLTADTRNLTKQIEAAVQNASRNTSVDIHCNLNGLNSVSQQIGAAVSQLQTLRQTALSLNNDINLKVSVDTSGLSDCRAQLEKLTQSSSTLQMPSLKAATPQLGPATPKADVSLTPNTASSIKETTTESKNLLDTINKITSVAKTPLTLFGPGGLTEGYDKLFGKVTKNLD